MIKLTLARAKTFAKKAAQDNGINADVLEAKWQGQGGVDSTGLRWRSARVKMAVLPLDGRTFWKAVNMDVSGWVRVS